MSNPAKIKRFLDRDLWICQMFTNKQLESTAAKLAARIAFHLHIESGRLQVSTESLGAHDLMRPFPAEPMRMRPTSTRVNKPENDADGQTTSM